MQLEKPTELNFINNMREKQYIARIQASGYNSAAYNKKDNFFLWGSTSRGKLGIPSITKDVLEPLHVQFELIKKNTKNTNNDDIGGDGHSIQDEAHLEPFIEQME